MNNGIKPFEVVEGNLQAVKDTSDWSDENMWQLYIKSTRGYYERIQWMSVYNIQDLFNTKLPKYEDKSSRSNQYKLAQ
jgi:hypothetical protein